MSDLRYAFRLLWKDRAFTLAALLTLVVCIGANAAIFSIVRSVVLEPLPVPAADRLVYLHNSYPNAGAVRASTGVPDYFDRLREMTVFDEQALYRREGMTAGVKDGAERVPAVRATPSFYRVTGAQPVAGRMLTDDDATDRARDEGRAELRPVAAGVCRRPRRHRARDPPEQSGLRDRRRDAAGLPVPVERHRRLAAGGVHAPADVRRPAPQQQLADGRAPEGGRDRRAGAAATRRPQRAQRRAVSAVLADPEGRGLPQLRGQHAGRRGA